MFAVRMLLLSTGTVLSMCGCHQAARHQQSAVVHFDQGAPLAALEAFDHASESRHAEDEIIAFDRAIAALAAGQPEVCETAVRETRKQIEFLSQKDLRESTASYVTDDQAIAWSGREFEQRMIDGIAILSSLVGNRQDAFAFAGQAMERIHEDQLALQEPVPADGSAVMTVGLVRQEIPPPPARLSPNAFSSWLQAVIQSENPLNSELTAEALHQVSYWRGENPNADQTEFGAVRLGTGCGRGFGSVQVLTLTGRVTDWQTEHAEATSAALLIADRILSATSSHSLPPTLAPVPIAMPARHCSEQPFFTAATVLTADRPELLISHTLVDVNRAAFDSYLSGRDDQIARAVVRRIVKKGAVYAAKSQMNVSNNTGVDLLMNIAGVAWEAMEKADTRHLTLLPERVEALHMELPAGDHQLLLGVNTQTAAGRPLNEQVSVRVPVRVEDGRNTLVLCFRPDVRFVCSILVSDGQTPILIAASP
ncbi:MAG: hypothetical protein R3C49_16085 [Planctomycetaceae bacterium]